jgi:hypothetical protein
MEITAIDLACSIYGVSPQEILAAAFRPDGGLSVVLDRGIQGAPKYCMNAQDTDEALARCAAGAQNDVVRPQREAFYDGGATTVDTLPAIKRRARKHKPAQKGD